MICPICDHPIEEEDEVITTHRAFKGLFGSSPKVASTSFVSTLLHVDCVLDKEGRSR